MNRKMLAVMKKELARFFGDKRMVFTTLIMPGLMIYIMYSVLGNGLTEQFTTGDDYISQIYMVNEPDSLTAVFAAQEAAMDITTISTDEVADKKELVEEKDCDLLVVFPSDFDEAVSKYDNQTVTESAPEVEIYYNSTKTESSDAYTLVEGILDNYETSLCDKFDVNQSGEKYDLATDQDSAGQVFAMLLPMLMMTFMFSGCMAIAPEAIAGEKERGTIATLLVTPTKRSDIAIGKIVSLSMLSLLSGASSFVGIMLSIPKLMKMEDSPMSAAVYTVSDYVLLLLIIFSTVLIFVSLISVVSAFAKSIKEASTYVSPIMIIVMVIGISTMMGAPELKKSFWYLIPVYNSAQSLSGIFGFTYSLTNVIVTIIVNIFVSTFLGFILAKMFNSEKMMY